MCYPSSGQSHNTALMYAKMRMMSLSSPLFIGPSAVLVSEIRTALTALALFFGVVFWQSFKSISVSVVLLSRDSLGAKASRRFLLFFFRQRHGRVHWTRGACQYHPHMHGAWVTQMCTMPCVSRYVKGRSPRSTRCALYCQITKWPWRQSGPIATWRLFHCLFLNKFNQDQHLRTQGSQLNK